MSSQQIRIKSKKKKKAKTQKKINGNFQYDH